MKTRSTLLTKLTVVLALTFVFSTLNAQITINSASVNSSINSQTATQTVAKIKTTVSASNDWVNMMQNPNANFYTTQAAFEQYWAGKTPGKGKGYKVFKRWENFMTPRVYPTGTRPEQDIVAKEYAKFENAYPYVSTTKSATGTWSLIGPNGAPGGSVPNGSYQSPAGAGRVNCIRFNPKRPNSMWIGTPSGGAWKSYNAGTTWIPATDNTLSMGVSDIAIASDTNIIYIATGDADAGDTYSIGIMKSTDAGSTWQTTSFSFGVSSSIRIFKLLPDPTNSDRIFAATNAGLYLTTNGFATYTRIGASTIGMCYDVEFKPGYPTTNTTIYAAGTSIWYSTNDGSSWSTAGGTLPTTGVQRIAIAVSAAAPGNVWALYGQASDQGFYGFFTSTTSGATFATTYAAGAGNLLGWNPTFNDAGGQAFYDLSLAVSPTSASTIFIGGVNLQKSTTGGASWTCNGYWLSGAGYQYTHADHHAIEFLPGNGTTVFDGNDGGIFQTTNTGTNWADLSGTLAIGQIAGIGASQQNVIMTGWQDNGSNLANNGTWTIVYGGDGCEAIVDPTNNSIIYESYVQGKINRSINSGSTWTTISTATLRGEAGEWITPYVLHPTTNTTIFAGYANLWKSINSGTSWTREGIITGGTNSLIRIAVAPSAPTTVYVIKIDKIFKTSNEGATATWTDVTGTLSGYAFTDIVVKNSDPNTVWVTVSGYNNGSKVFKSTNGGTTWVNYSSNLPNIPFNAIVADKSNVNDGVYVGGDMGVYYRDNLMPNWALYNSRLPNAVISELEIYYDAIPANSKLRAGTYGRGLWQSDLYTCPDIAPVAGINADKTSLNACTGYVVNFLDGSDYVPTSWYWSFPGGTPSTSTLQNPVVTYPSTPTTYSVSLTATNSKGSSSITKTNYITVGEKAAPLEEDFTSTTYPPIQWTNSIWRRGTATGLNGSSGGAAYFNCYNLAAGTSGNLTTMNVDLTGVGTPVLKFNVAYRQYAAEADQLQVFVSTNCGSSWSAAIYNKSGTTLATVTPASTANFVPSASGNWRLENISLAAYVNQKVMIKFTGTSQYGNNIWIDDIFVGENTCSVGAAGTITGTQTLCQGTSGWTYSVPAITNATGYIWTLPTGATIVSGNNTRTITVDYSQTAINGNITVKGTATCGSGTVSAPLAITVNQIPATALTIVGPDICAGLPQTGKVYQIPYITNYTIGQTGYVWSLPSGATITAGDNTNKITIDFDLTAIAGDITVYGQNGCGSGNPSPTFHVTMGGPATPGTITGYSTICQGDDEIPYSITAVPGANSYTWSVPSGYTVASGQGTTSITVNFSSSAVSDNVSVYATNSCGNSSTNTLPITVNSAPTQPSTITGSANPNQSASVNYSVTNVGGVYYTWTIPNDWTINSGQGTNSINVTIGTNNGNITVLPSIGNCIGASRTLAVAPICAVSYKTRVIGSANWNTAATWIKTRTGTITTVNSGSGTAQATVTGTGTLFTTEVSVGDVIVLEATPGTVLPFTVLSITNNTSLLLNGAAGAIYTGVSFGIEKVPTTDGNVQIGNAYLSTADVNVTLDAAPTVSSLTFLANAYANTLTNSGTNALIVNGPVQINQPTANSKTNLWSINAGSATISGNLTIGGTNSTTTRISKVVLTTGTLNVYGNLSLTTNAVAGCQVTSVIDMSGGASTLNLKGAFNLTNLLGTLAAGTTSTFNYNGTSAQTALIGVSAVTYCNLKFNNTSGATLGAAINATNVTGNLSVETGTLNNGGYAIVLNSKVLSVSNGATFKLSGTSGMATGTSSKTFGITSTTEYNGTTQNVSGETYGHLMISGSGTKTAATGFTVKGNLTIASGATLDGASYTHALEGNWTNNGGTFTPSTSTINFNSTSVDQNINGTAATQTFNNLTVAKSSNKLILSGSTTNVIVGGILIMTSGNIDCVTNTLTLGSSTASVGTLSYTSGNIIGNFMRWINATGTGILFPVGTVADNRKALVTFTNLTNGSLTAKFIASNPGSTGLPLTDGSYSIDNQFTEGYWSLIAANSLASTNYALELTGTNFVSHTWNSDVRIIKRTTGGGSWTIDGNHIAGVSPTAKRSGLSGISSFEFAHATATIGSSAPSVTIQPVDASTCEGTGTPSFSVTASGSGLTYQWQECINPSSCSWANISTCTGVYSGCTTSTLTLTNPPVGKNGYKYRCIVHGTIAPDATSNEVTLTVNPFPAAAGAISGTATVCQGVSGVSYSVGAIANSSIYTWTYSGTGATISGSTNAVTIDFAAGATGGNLTVKGTNSCGNGTVSANYAITVNSLPAAAGTISGTTAVCQGQSGISYSVGAIANATSYTWSYSGTGATINGTTNNITIDFAAGATSGNLTVKGTNSCGNGTVSANYAISVSSMPDAAGTITGTAGVCQGQSGVVYSVGTITNASSYTWTYTGSGATINGSNENITIDFAAGATSGDLTVKGTSACGNSTVSANYAITVTSLPVAAGTISGSSTVCQEQSGVSYSVGAITNATSYTWAYSGTGATINGSSNNITIDFAAGATSGNLTVKGTNSCGNGTVSANYAITVNPLPNAAGAISGTAAVCQNQSGVSYSVAAITNATSYTWAYSGTGATINGTTNIITIDYSAGATSGNLTVKGTNSCGNGTVSANYAITINSVPSAAGTISGSSTVCQSQSGVSYSVGAIANATSYIWAYSGTGATINGSTENITIDFSAGATSGNLTVKGTSACGNGTTSANYAITVNPTPGAAGTITGTATVTQGQTGIAYSVGAITNATSYTWTYSGTGATINGTLNNRTIDFSGTATSGNLTVYGTNSCGNGTVSANYPITVNSAGTTYYSNSSGDPSTLANWGINTDGTGTNPPNFTTSGDIFIIRSANTMVTTANWTIGSGAAGNIVTLQINGNLSISGNGIGVTISSYSVVIFNSSNQILLAGTSSGNSFTLSANATLKTINASGVSGPSCSLPTTASKKTVTLNTGANYEFNGAVQSMTGTPVTVNNLTFSVSGAKAFLSTVITVSGNLTMSGTATTTTTANLAITGNLVVGSGTTFAIGTNFTLGITGTTNVTGTLTLAGTGAKTFTGNATLNSGGVWNETGIAAINFGGNLINDATTFTANTGTHTFTGTGKTISGASTTAIPNLTISGTTTNNGTLTVSTALAGASTLTNGATGILNYGGSGAIVPTLTAFATGNTVNYNYAGAQTVKGTTYYNLTLSGSGSKTTTGVTVNGTLSLEGTATASAALTYDAGSTIQYKGSGAQTTGVELPATFGGSGGLIIANTSGFAVTLANAIVLGGPLTINSSAKFEISPTSTLTVGGVTANAGTFTIKSNVSGTGSFIDNGTITGAGTYTVEKYLAKGRWWYIGSPITSATAGAAFGIIASPTTGTGNRLYYWDASSTNQWIPVTNISYSTEVLRGYSFKDYDASPYTALFTGTLNTGNIGSTTNLAYHTGNSAGFNLVCNPYPSAINWGCQSIPTTGLTQNNLLTSVWYRTDPLLTGGSFATYNWQGNNGNGIGQNGGERYIPAMQAFWVKTNGSTGGLQMTNATRVHNGTSSYKTGETSVFRFVVADSTAIDEAVISFDQNAQSIFEDYDSEKMFATDDIPQVFTLTSDNTEVAINGQPELLPAEERIISLGFKTPIASNFTMNATNLIDFDQNISVYLEDVQQNVIQDLRLSSVYNFSSGIVDNASRFRLHFGNFVTGISTVLEDQATTYSFANSVYVDIPNSNSGVVELYDVLGNLIYKQNIAKGLNKLNIAMTQGIYVSVVKIGNKDFTQKIIIIKQ